MPQGAKERSIGTATIGRPAATGNAISIVMAPA